MATRKIIDIEQNGEKVWPKSHAEATFMSDGTTVEDAINQIGTGGGDASTVPQDTYIAPFTTEDMAFCARMPSVFGYEPNVPDQITSSPTP